MSFGRLSDIINDIRTEIDTLLKSKNVQENQLFDKHDINTYTVSIFSNIKNKYPEVTVNDVNNIFTRF